MVPFEVDLLPSLSLSIDDTGVLSYLLVVRLCGWPAPAWYGMSEDATLASYSVERPLSISSPGFLRLSFVCVWFVYTVCVSELLSDVLLWLSLVLP